MPLTCPNCGGKRPRLSKARGTKEKLLRWLGIYPVRCEECNSRFTDSLWRFSEAIFARCPRCYRMDLGTWDARHYTPPTKQLMAMSFGAKRFRCEACRCNFVSFRKLNEKSTFRRQGRNEESQISETASPDSNIQVG